MIPVPSYLKPPENIKRFYGKLKHINKSWVIEGEPFVIEFAKRLFPGCSGRGRGVAWFPANKRTSGDLNWLMHRYPLELERPELWAKALEEATNHVLVREELLRRPQQIVPGANFKGELRPFQQEGLAFLLHNGRTLLADEMGLGKTVQALALMSETQCYPAILVVPPHLVRNWVKEITRFLVTPGLPGENLTLFGEPGEKNIHVITGLKPYDLPAANIYIIHYLLLRGWKKYLPEYGFSAVIFDEIQELRHRRTEKYSSASLLAGSCEIAVGLSGTPIYNRGGEIWNVMNILEYHCLGDWDSFTREWCSGYGGDIVVDPTLLGEYLKREGLMLRRTKDQVLKELPPKRRVVQTIDFDTGLYGELIQGAIEKAMGYDSIKEFMERGRVKREIENETRQAIGIAKARHVATFVKMLLEAGEKVLLFAYHHAVHDTYMAELKEFRPVKITGRETGKQKDESVEAFMGGKSPVCIISLRAAAGLNLQAANCVVFGELDWSPAIHCLDEQTEILTDKGFLGVDDVAVGDMVAAFDIKDGSIRFVPTRGKVDRLAEPNETFYRINTKRIDLAVTGQHRMVFRKGKRIGAKSNGPPWGVAERSEWAIETADKLAGKKRRYIPTAGYEFAPGVDLTDDELRLIGLFISDGNFNGKHLTIYQSKKQPWNNDIVKILNGAGVSWTLFQRKERKKGENIVNWYIIPSGDQPRWTEKEVSTLKEMKKQGVSWKEISNAIGRTKTAVELKWRKLKRGLITPPGSEKPQKGWRSLAPYLDKNLSPLLENVTVEQLDCLLHGLFLGDGTKKRWEAMRITNTNKLLLDRLQSICVRRGKSANIFERKLKTSSGNPAYDIYISDAQDASLYSHGENIFTPDREPATGQRVWCVENEIGTIVVRRNGKVAIIGNSQAEDRAHRIGQEDSVLCYYLVCEGGTDEAIQDALGIKVSQFLGLMGDKVEGQEDRIIAQTAAGEHMNSVIEKLKAVGQEKKASRRSA